MPDVVRPSRWVVDVTEPLTTKRHGAAHRLPAAAEVMRPFGLMTVWHRALPRAGMRTAARPECLAGTASAGSAGEA